MNEETCKTCIYFEPCMGICKLDEDFVTGNDFCSNHEEGEEE
jgi:radical SAM protein with 4Fe4S-binding SPASM domain